MLQNSVKPGTEIFNYPLRLPSEITWNGYQSVFSDERLMPALRNSTIIAVSVTVLNVVFNSMAAYALTKLRFGGRDTALGIMLGSMMIPGILLLVPVYLINYRLQMVGTLLPLIVPAAVSAYNIFLLRQFISQIPDSLIESARIDGASEFVIFSRIIIPLINPALITVAIITFLNAWNDLFGPVLYLFNKPELRTLQLWMFELGALQRPEIEEIRWAANVVITVPLILVYFLMQERFMEAFANVRWK